MKSSNIKGKNETIKTKENLSQILGNENLNNPSKIIKMHIFAKIYQVQKFFLF